ncbi:MAG: NAD-dependent epimerase/dehydratase family protein, partial [Candidatus Binataceae bacterium]
KIYQAAGQEIFGYRGEVQYRISADTDYLTDNPNRRCPSIEKARAILNYTPEIRVEDGIRRYLKFLDAERTAKA